MIKFLKNIFGLKNTRYNEELEAEYKNNHNHKMQELEDKLWDNHIEYLAKGMIMEYENNTWMNKLTNGKMPWLASPILIPHANKIYKIYDWDSAKYKNTQLIYDLIMRRYHELLLEIKNPGE